MDFIRNRTLPVFYDYIPVYEIWIQYDNVFKRYRPEPFFIRRSRAITLIIIGDFILYRTWPVFYDYIPVCEIWIQFANVFKRYRQESIFHTEIKGHNSDNNRLILSVIELDLYFMIINLCMKYESNTLLCYNSHVLHLDNLDMSADLRKGF